MRYTLLLAFLLYALALAGCKTSPINGEALLPATQADLNALSSDVDKDRTNTKAGFDAVTKDLQAAKVATQNTEKASADVQSKINEVAARPKSGGLPGALINAIAGSGVLPPWLDWLLTLGGTALGINVTRNKTRAKALAKVATPKAPATPPAS